MKLAYTLLFLFLLSSTIVSAQNRSRNKGVGVKPEILNAYEARNFHGLPYRFLLPKDYDAKKQYPLILNLHGAGGVGDDNETQMRNWTEVFVDKAWRDKYPCVVVAPQSWDSWHIYEDRIPELSEEEIAAFGPDWLKRYKDGRIPSDTVPTGSLTMALLLVDKVAQDYSIDTKRVYVMGHSMGGVGSWNAIWAEPKRFTAVIPSAGGLPPWKDKTRFKDVPIWTFHGDIDPVVPFSFSQGKQKMIIVIKNDLRFTSPMPALLRMLPIQQS